MDKTGNIGKKMVLKNWYKIGLKWIEIEKN
jgi:hypothetical protein